MVTRFGDCKRQFGEYYVALVPAGRKSFSHRMSDCDLRRSGSAQAILWAGFLTALVAGPWLLPGYLFGTDWPGPRRLDLPTAVESSALVRAALAAISWLIGSEATGKLLVLGALFTGAALAYRAVQLGGFVPRALAATIYIVNPFVYGRLHYCQVFLLAGYAVLPWVAARLQRLLVNPGLTQALVATVSLSLIGILSLQMFLISFVLAAVLVVAHLGSPARKMSYARRLLPYGLLTAAAAIVVSAYWIIPLVNGRGPEGTTLAGTGPGDLRAYAAIPDQALGLVPNLLGLYGFWAENTGRFTSMKAFVPLWPLILAGLLAVGAIGAYAALRRRGPLMPWAIGLIAAAAIGLVLEMGISHPFTATLVSWLDANVPLYRGMRDAGKWAALLVLAYSQLGGLGAAAMLDWLERRQTSAQGMDWRVGLASGILLTIPIYYGNGLLYGAHGEIKPSAYPPGWYSADRVLTADPHPDRALFLPWHEYMSMSFVRNQNNVVASPAPTFFSIPVLVSFDPEVSGVVPPAEPEQAAITGLVLAGDQGRWAEVLASHNVKYVLLARDVDWKGYSYLDGQSGLVKVADFGSIVLYRNTLLN
jgi:hypothetical protein